MDTTNAGLLLWLWLLGAPLVMAIIDFSRTQLAGPHLVRRRAGSQLAGLLATMTWVAGMTKRHLTPSGGNSSSLTPARAALTTR